MEARLKEAIRKYVRERNIKKTLDEMSVTGNVAGYNTPAAFSKPGQTKKKNNRLASVTGGTVVDDLEEGLTSSAGAPFTKPSEVAGKNAKLAKLSGATVVEGEKDWALGDIPASRDEALPMKPTAAKEVDKAKVADISGMIVAEMTERDVKRILQSTDTGEKLEITLDDGKKVVVQRVGKNSQGPTFKHIQNNKPIGTASALAAAYIKKIKRLAENRWVALKKEDGSAKAKIGKGITSIKQQLGEVEKFVNWYSKLKTENGVTNDDYYKRTHKSLHKIKERLMNLSEKIRTL
jgi:hypothetical protein